MAFGETMVLISYNNPHLASLPVFEPYDDSHASTINRAWSELWGLTGSQATIITKTTRSQPLPVQTGFQDIANQRVVRGTVSGRVTLNGKGARGLL